jgi:hypothetical protein
MQAKELEPRGFGMRFNSAGVYVWQSGAWVLDEVWGRGVVWVNENGWTRWGVRSSDRQCRARLEFLREKAHPGRELNLAP